MKHKAFTLVEMVVVVAIISIVASLLLPVFWTARGRARQSVCLSNLHQIGIAVSLYTQDYDDLYPYGVDHQDRFIPGAWSSLPVFAARVPRLPSVKDLLTPYTKASKVFECPADTGYDLDDFYVTPLSARPSSFAAFGSSYYYHTGLAAYNQKVGSDNLVSDNTLFFDAAGHWHGSLFPIQRRYNVLFTDLHLKNVSEGELAALRSPENYPELSP